MSDWDASDVEEPKVVIPIKKQWDDEDAEDEIKESWEDSDEEVKVQAPAPKKKLSLAQKLAEREAREQAEKEEKARLAREARKDTELTPEELRERREAQKRMQEESDLQNAADLFGDIKIQDSDLKELNTDATPEQNLEAMSTSGLKLKADFEKYGKLLSEIVLKHKTHRQYSGMIEDLVRGICDPLKDTELRKIASALTAAANEKQRAAKAALKGKSKGAKKSNVRVDSEVVDTSSAAKAGMLDGYDEFDEFDDFM